MKTVEFMASFMTTDVTTLVSWAVLGGQRLPRVSELDFTAANLMITAEVPASRGVGG